MHQNYILAHSWSIIEEGYEPERFKSSESLFSLGNGAMGQRANFEEFYSGPSFQGSYIGGVYYPDKTKVGWWKNGYPEYFAKVLNAPSWIGIDFYVNDDLFDLKTCLEVQNFKRELNMKSGYLSRSFECVTMKAKRLKVEALRFLSMTENELGVISYRVTALDQAIEIRFEPYLDSGIKNQDSNWDDDFWKTTSVSYQNGRSYILAQTLKTDFKTCTYMYCELHVDQKKSQFDILSKEDTSIRAASRVQLEKGQTAQFYKYGGYTTSLNHNEDGLVQAADYCIDTAISKGFKVLFAEQEEAWANIWANSDIVIEGDVKAQQGIRFNIFHLNQTYSGKDARLNIGPKGFTGEKYGGSTYWDTEAYCLPFYMLTKNQDVARNLLVYRYNHLDRAKENAKKLGFNSGAALYPMVTMNGEECHNEWEITFEEIHRNGAIAFAIYNYVRFTGDFDYLKEMGLEVLIGIARFWKQRVHYSQAKNAYVMLGVTGPNEYENNVNNNWYTNYIAKWCLEYTLTQLHKLRDGALEEYDRIRGICALPEFELEQWSEIADQMYFPYSDEHQIYLQQDGFLDKQLQLVSELQSDQRPINQKWSWDRILRSPYIKQADVLQGFYFFEDHFSLEELERHYNFYEPFTVHESSLSPCIHNIQAAKLGKMDQAYDFYLRTSRLDLDDYNKEVEEGLHITSMAGTWLSIIEGFGGLRIENDKLSLRPQIPEQWDSYRFKINFRGRIISVHVDCNSLELHLKSDIPMSLRVFDKKIELAPNKTIKV
tara:strand:+ start:15471 stop:17774 length:2304 start_codon:yes stop_codon:yes gene_type:complete